MQNAGYATVMTLLLLGKMADLSEVSHLNSYVDFYFDYT